MNNKRATKRALLTSVMALVMCVVMLVGTTLAWFTDTASAGVNKIQAGNLDIEVEYSKTMAEGSWKAIDNTTIDLFTDKDGNAMLWEPGAASVVYLRIANKGNLAVKYTMALNKIDEVEGENVEGKTFKLSDYIMFGYTDVTAAYADRETAINAVSTDAVKLDTVTIAKDAALTDTNETKTVALVVYMPTSVGNEANYRGEKVPSIDLKLNVAATQYAYESDSFNNKYDENAPYPTVDAAALVDAIKNGGTVLFGDDMQTPKSLTVTKDVALSLNGQTWTVGDNTKLADGANLSVSGGKVRCETYAGYVSVRPGTTTDSVVTYTDVDFTGLYNAGRGTRGSSTTHTDYVLKYTPEAGGHTKLVFKNCTFTNSAIQFSGLSGNDGTFEAVFENCTFNALTNSTLIEVGSYLTNSTITIKDCTFNVTATSNFSVIDGNYGRAATVNFEGSNSFNGVVATPTGADKKGTAEEIKIFSEDLNVKACSAKTVNGLDTVTVSGIIKK